MTLIAPAVLLLVLMLASYAGFRLQRALSDRHRTRETMEAVRLVLGMLITFAALVLGLLTTSAKAHFDLFRTGLQAYAVDLITVDQRLREYGPAAQPIRAELRAYTASAIATTWPDELPPSGIYPRRVRSFSPGSSESVELGAMLLRIDHRVASLPASQADLRGLVTAARSQMGHVLEQRFMLLASAEPTLTGWFLGVMTAWLILVFAVFGLSAPDNRVVYAVIAATALSLSGAMWLIMELDTPLSGFIAVSSEPLRNALLHMDAAEE
jgi:hypothetical protein